MTRFLLPLCALLMGFAAGALWFASFESVTDVARPAASPAHEADRTESADPLKRTITTLESLQGTPTLDQFAAIGNELAKLDSKQMAALLDYVEKHSTGWTDRRLETLMRWWVKQDPTAASAWMQPRLERWAQDGPWGMNFSSAKELTVRAWAQALPREALSFARQHPRSGLAVLLAHHFNVYGPEKDPAKRHSIWLDFPEGATRSKAIEENISYWAGKQPADAVAAAHALPAGPSREASIATAFRKWSEKDPSAAFEMYRELKFNDTPTLSKILAGISAKDPAKALAHLEKLEPSRMTAVAPTLVDAWARRDPAAALAWALEHEVSIQNQARNFRPTIQHNGFSRQTSYGGGDGQIAPLINAMQSKPDATIAWLQSLPNAADRERLTLQAIHYMPPERRMAIFNELSTDGQTQAINAAVQSFGKDSSAAKKWAEGLPVGRVRSAAWYQLGSIASEPLEIPPGPDRDAMLHGRAQGQGTRVAEKSLDLVLQINDSVRRRDAFDSVMEEYVEGVINQGEKAREWMEKADLPEEWKRPWRASTPPSSSPPQ